MDRPVAADRDPLSADAGGGLRLRVRVQPRAARHAVVGRHGDELKVRLAAPPVDGAANDALVRWLADVLDLPRAAVTLSAGHSSRSKVVAITGITAADARARLGLDRDEPPLHRSPPAR